MQIQGTFLEILFIRFRLYLIPAVLARERVCRMVLVLPPIAMSTIKALSIESRLTISSGLISLSIQFFRALAASLNNLIRAGLSSGFGLLAVCPDFGGYGAVAFECQPELFPQCNSWSWR